MKFTKHIPNTKHIGFHNKYNFHKINEIGLKKAYQSDKKLHVDGDTLFIAGTSNKQDVWDDITKIPFYGSVKDSQRYKDAEEVLKTNPQVKNLVGHSLAGSVALEFEKQYKDKFDTTTYGAPVLQLSSKKGKRFRHPGDPISIFDNGAINVPKFSFNPLSLHSFEGYS